MYITSPLKFLSETFASFLKLFVKKLLEPWINANIQIVAQVSKIDVWDKHSKKKGTNV